jgi:hypothetical protein
MKQGSFVVIGLLLGLGLAAPFYGATNAAQEPGAQTNTQLKAPSTNRRRHRRSESRHGGIKHNYGSAGRSMGRGGKRFGKNMAKGKPIVAGRELGKGTGGFGKGVGKGTAGVGRKVGRKTKHAVTK